ncbi:MFS transporter [Streptomyces phaeochromogenes]|uniref:MFS transporter n=1 Tax=Streptomyces phaeochromogenes TaxID=1923 RepID=UPI003409C8AB
MLLALVGFALGHLVAALSSSFALVLAASVVTAPATGTFWCVGAIVATTAAGPAATSRALGMLLGGLTVATVAGVPQGAWLGQLSGRRGPFWVLAALSAGAAAVIGRYIPADERREAPSARAEFAVLRDVRIWLILSAMTLLMGGVADLWNRFDVKPHAPDPKTFHHPDVGDLHLGYESMWLEHSQKQRFVVFFAEPGSSDHDKLILLDAEHDELGLDVEEGRLSRRRSAD